MLARARRRPGVATTTCGRAARARACACMSMPPMTTASCHSPTRLPHKTPRNPELAKKREWPPYTSAAAALHAHAPPAESCASPLQPHSRRRHDPALGRSLVTPPSCIEGLVTPGRARLCRLLTLRGQPEDTQLGHRRRCLTMSLWQWWKKRTVRDMPAPSARNWSASCMASSLHANQGVLRPSVPQTCWLPAEACKARRTGMHAWQPAGALCVPELS